MVSGVSSYSETPASLASIRASYRLAMGLSATVAVMAANCARKQSESRQRGTLIAERPLGPTRSRRSAHPSKPGR